MVKKFLDIKAAEKINESVGDDTHHVLDVALLVSLFLCHLTYLLEIVAPCEPSNFVSEFSIGQDH